MNIECFVLFFIYYKPRSMWQCTSRMPALRAESLPWWKLLELCKSAELSRTHSLAMLQTSVTVSVQVDAISKNKSKKFYNIHAKQHQGQKNNKNQQNKRPCSRCGSNHQPRHCPAYENLTTFATYWITFQESAENRNDSNHQNIAKNQEFMSTTQTLLI